MHKDRSEYNRTIEEYPNYKTQGETLEESKDNLLDLHKEFASGEIPYVLKVGEFSIA